MPPINRKSQTVSIPAPIMGWNVRDPLPSMPPQYASIMDNTFCMPDSIMVRKGYESWATFTGVGETVFDYDGATSGSEKVFVAVDNAGACSVYDITASGAVGAPVISGLTSARIKHAHMATSGGNFTYIVNGADDARLFDGTTWYQVNTGSSPYAITGIASSSLSDVITFKRRLWFVESGSLRAWYLPIDSVAGAAVSYDFGPVFKRGGSIVKIDTWSLDAGEGLDDHMVIFSSTGEVAVYRGTDPASASTWGLIGVFYEGAPLGTGRSCKFGGDLLVATHDGIAQMSQSLMSSRVTTVTKLTDKVQPQMAQDAYNYSANYGWDLMLFPPQNMLIMNIPVDSTTSYQYVMNTISGAWSRWTGIPAKSWYFANDNLFFGADGYVGRMWQGNSDNGTIVSADILPAYQNFGSASRLKRCTLCSLSIANDGTLEYGVRLEVDFSLNPATISLPASISAIAAYGTAVYGTSLYGGSLSVNKRWFSVNGIGYYVSPHVRIDTQYADVHLYAIDLNLESGGTI
jgi:hypothetical protein